MTSVTITRKNNRIVSVECDGHTNYGVQGEDIVCAALSSVVQTALLGLMAVAAIAVKYTRDDKAGKLSMIVPDDITDEQRKAADYILETMLLGVSDLNEGYSDFIELIIK
ncbi:MAG: ribosomal-processing cysteine protease Prp [Firmicutes bacterium]|nr:ribosomal-processing cysteine protease Prp [Bacillota bacterium]